MLSGPAHENRGDKNRTGGGGRVGRLKGKKKSRLGGGQLTNGGPDFANKKSHTNDKRPRGGGQLGQRTRKKLGSVEKAGGVQGSRETVKKRGEKHKGVFGQRGWGRVRKNAWGVGTTGRGKKKVGGT